MFYNIEIKHKRGILILQFDNFFITLTLTLCYKAYFGVINAQFRSSSQQFMYMGLHQYWSKLLQN